MTQGILTSAWTITPNLRKAYTSLNDGAAWWFYQNHLAIKAKWTLKWTCDGVTGPTGVGDATDRLTDATKTATRATVAAAAQSWAVYSNADGVQMKITYQGATDDVLKTGYSASVGYTLAGTTTQEPTASDECAHTTISVYGSSTTLDRVMSIWVRDDGRGWRCSCWRSNTSVSTIWVDKGTPLAGGVVMAVPYSKGHIVGFTRSIVNGYPMGGPGPVTMNTVGFSTRAVTDSSRNVPLGGGNVSLCDSPGGYTTDVFNSNLPAAQANEGFPLLPIFWSGVKGANTDGFFLSPLDWWAGYASALSIPAAGDHFPGYDPDDVFTDPARTNWLVALGSAAIWPWRDVAAGMSTS